MIVRCPYCNQGNELEDPSSFHALCCATCGSSLNLEEDPNATVAATSEARQFGHFQLIEILGHGAFGTVWKACDQELDRIVALKVPRQQSLSRAEVVRFLREARAAAQLRHPNVVSVHEVGEYDGVPYIVSDYIDGINLKSWILASERSPEVVAELCEKVARAVHHAHEHGIVHRDLKPSNIMVDLQGEPHVMDFGLAKREMGEVTLTMDGAIIGTPDYMPPEQAQGKGHLAGRPSDVYSLGVALFEMLTRELPFRGGKSAVLYKILTEAPPSPRSLNVNVPVDLETVCLRCMEKEPTRRYQSCMELANELERYRLGFPVLARPVGTVGRIWRWYLRNPKASVLTAAGYMLCLMVILTIWGMFGILLVASGLHAMERPGTAIVELISFFVLLYLPGYFAGVKVLNGNFLATWMNFLLLLADFITVLAIIFDLGPDLEILSAASDSEYTRYQLATLLGTMVLLGIVLHVIALVSLRQLKRPQAIL